MKKIFKIAILLLFSLNAFSQTPSYPYKFNVAIGGSVLGMVTNYVDYYEDLTEYVEGAKTIPVLNAGYNYKINKISTIGVALSHQNYIFNLVFPEDSISGKLGLYRTNIGFRYLANYVDNRVINIYSGLRLGLSYWKIKAESKLIFSFLDKLQFNIPINPEYSTSTTVFSFQIVFFGMEVYLTQNIAIGGELALGSPYFATLGASYRFHKFKK